MQSSERMQNMKPDYKNWMPKGMILGCAAGTVLCAGIGGIAYGLMPESGLRTAIVLTADAGIVAGVCFTAWCLFLYKAFDYNGKRKMSKQIIEGLAEYVSLPEGGVGLDVGCGSGALIIACAKRNTRGRMIGIDRWGKEYASFSQSLCVQNAKAEGVTNVSFQKGDATKLDFPDESFDAVTSNYVYHNIFAKDRQVLIKETLRCLKKGGTFAIHDIFSKSKYGDMQKLIQELRDSGYEQVQLIDTTNGMFMSKREAVTMGLAGSAILYGRK